MHDVKTIFFFIPTGNRDERLKKTEFLTQLGFFDVE